MELDAKLEAALRAELFLSNDLRSQILDIVQEINDMTKLTDSDEVDNEIKSEHAEELTVNMEDVSTTPFKTEGYEQMSEFLDASQNEDVISGIKINCFPVANTKAAPKTQQLATAKLSYLNHAELLKKYSGI